MHTADAVNDSRARVAVPKVIIPNDLMIATCRCFLRLRYVELAPVSGDAGSEGPGSPSEPRKHTTYFFRRLRSILPPSIASSVTPNGLSSITITCTGAFSSMQA